MKSTTNDLPVAEAVWGDGTTASGTPQAEALSSLESGEEAKKADDKQYLLGKPSAPPPAESSSSWPYFAPPETTTQQTVIEDTVTGDRRETVIYVSKWDDRDARHAFIRRVYGILGVQMLATLLVCGFMTLHASCQAFVLQHAGGLQLGSYLFSIVILVALFCYKDKYPVNLALLGVWTIALSITVGTITSIYAAAGAMDIVLEALLLTTVVFLGLSLFTLQSKYDFSFLGAGLGMALMVMIFWSILGMIFGFRPGLIYSLFGVIIFSGYIIFDTYMLTTQLDPDDYIIAAISLYLDIINLFLYLLQFLDAMQRR